MSSHALGTVASGSGPRLSRRSFIAGTTLASAGGALFSSGSASAAEIGLEVAEREELLRLGSHLASVHAEYEAATADERKIVAEWSPLWPSCPEILHCGWGGIGGEIERDLVGFGISHSDESGASRTRSIRTAASLERSLRDAEHAVQRAKSERARAASIRIVKQIQSQLAAAQEYEHECARIREQSGYMAAYQRRLAIEKRLLDLTVAILRERPLTMVGIVIQAKAVSAANTVDLVTRMANEATLGVNWADALAASILRLNG